MKIQGLSSQGFVLISAGVLALGVGIGFLVHTYWFGSGNISKCAHLFKLTNPTIDCNATEEAIDRLSAVEKNVREIIDKAVAEGKAKRISVWSRDLSTNRWIGINETEQYSPASLLKVPLMAAYFKYSELDPNILNTPVKLEIDQDYNKEETFRDASYNLLPGETYTVSQLINSMIMYSDNNAAVVLLNHIGKDFFKKVNEDFGVTLPSAGGAEQNFVTVRSYANIFRSLYNASYLNRDLSEKALDILSKSTFKRGIRAGVPNKTDVAVKFGERTATDVKGNVVLKELHDCGTVYLPQGAYTLCIMTEGTDFNALTKIIQEISKEVYKGSQS